MNSAAQINRPPAGRSIDLIRASLGDALLAIDRANRASNVSQETRREVLFVLNSVSIAWGELRVLAIFMEGLRSPLDLDAVMACLSAAKVLLFDTSLDVRGNRQAAMVMEAAVKIEEACAIIKAEVN